MSRRITFSPKEYYHLYNRGTEKRNIFLRKGDYERFITLLYLCNSEIPVHIQIQGKTLSELTTLDRGDRLVDICAYCLMPNHFHILAREIKDGGISLFMQKIMTGYTMYFNKRNERSGVLFQGKFRATHADNDAYLSYLISYIHLNPVKIINPQWKERGITNESRAKKFLKEYWWSSYPDYLGQKRTEGVIVEKESLPAYCKTPEDFEHAVEEWLNYNAKIIKVRP